MRVLVFAALLVLTAGLTLRGDDGKLSRKISLAHEAAPEAKSLTPEAVTETAKPANEVVTQTAPAAPVPTTVETSTEIPSTTEEAVKPAPAAVTLPAAPAASTGMAQMATADANTATTATATTATATTATATTTTTTTTTTKAPCKNCKPSVSAACKGHVDACRNETECCEIDKCNIWQHVGRDAATLLVFYVSWCPVSRDFMLPYDLLRAEFEPFADLLVAKVDADQNPNLVAEFGVDEFPTIVFMRRDCYWSAGGCLDPFVWKRYNGTSNDVDSVSTWAHAQLLDEQNENAFRQLPSQPDTLTGCKVDKVTPLPNDMQERMQVPALLQQGEGVMPAVPAKRPTCPLESKQAFL